MMRSFLALVSVLSVACCAAQDRITLMNGQEFNAKVIGQSTLEIRYLLPKGSRLVERAEPTESVFSVTDSTGQEKVWYFMDPAFGNDYTVPEMRLFLKGERDARSGYKPLVPMIGGFVLGAGLVMALDLEVNALLIPPAYAAIMSWPRVNVTRGSITDMRMEGDPIYATGYSVAARPKRVVRCLISAAAGIVVGYAVRQLVINPNNPDTY